jgi:hypothetical protein
MRLKMSGPGWANQVKVKRCDLGHECIEKLCKAQNSARRLGQNLKGRLALRYRFASRVEESPESKDVFRRLLQASSSRYEEQ